MEISVTVDRSGYDRQVSDLAARVLKPALQEVADYLGAAARQRLMAETVLRFDNPVAWTVNAFAYRRDAAGDDAGTYVFVLGDQAQYFGLEVEGGPRVAGDYATTKGGPLVPASGAADKLDAEGNLPRNFVRDAVAAGAHWMRLKVGEPEALVLPGRGRLQVLAVISERIEYQPRFLFADIVRDAVLQKALAAVTKYLSGAR
ncbi:hypothetical protein SAMN02799622_04199 [Methylobacterium sp. UNC378MF]|uniref:hypothetical protein n=1 Tax=Methylobacterium sp. UNC378MF TaxID=1502748 RepID=UPI0008827DFD|nr:hypothetical protein [Methylobacterium sp. UNC378MF]SDA27986.1 hypothetical protein SAMN02799622_04199 [Methylobacterium sp. UNC378MF]